MTLYTCKECGKAVAITPEKIVRVCGHDTAGVDAKISAKCIGQGSVSAN